MKQILAEIQGLRDVVKERDADDKSVKKRLASRSPGVTPKSSVHRSLARLGMLDSPDLGEHRTWLEEFLERYTAGREINLTEDQVRRSMAADRGVGFSELTRVLHGLALQEQQRGQRGLSKFLTKWKNDFTEDEGPSFMTDSAPSDMTRSWSVVSENPPLIRAKNSSNTGG